MENFIILNKLYKKQSNPRISQRKLYTWNESKKKKKWIKYFTKNGKKKTILLFSMVKARTRAGPSMNGCM